jgi:hypothetical protein
MTTQRCAMKFFDLIINKAANDPDYLESVSTMVLTGFMTVLVFVILI